VDRIKQILKRGQEEAVPVDAKVGACIGLDNLCSGVLANLLKFFRVVVHFCLLAVLQVVYRLSFWRKESTCYTVMRKLLPKQWLRI